MTINIYYSVLKSITDTFPKEESCSWDNFVNVFAKPIARGKMTLNEYLACKEDKDRKHLSDKQKDGIAYFPGNFIASDSKSKGNIKSRTMAVLDLDDGAYTFNQLIEKFNTLGCKCIIHSSYSHSQKCGKFRVYIPFDKPVTEDIDGTCSRVLDYFTKILGTHIDEKCWTVSQIYFAPSCPIDAVDQYCFKQLDGKPIRIDNFKMKPIDQDQIKSVSKSVVTWSVADYNQRADWEITLEKMGWRYRFTDRNKNIYFAHPDKGNGISGVVFKNSNIFYNFSSNPAALPFVADKAYSPFSAYILIEHGGDATAAANQLRSEGYGDSADVDADQTEDAAQERALSCFPEVQFPLDVLPEYFKNLVTEYSKAYQCSPAFIAMIFLTIISGAAGNAIALKLKRKWRTAPFLWFYIIGVSGDGKSPAENAAMEPIHKLQNLEKVRYNQELKKYQQELAILKKSQNSDHPIEPHKLRNYYSGNFTIEALIPMFQSYSRGLILHVDELAGLFNSLNQYRAGKGADVEHFLSLFDCNPLKSDRKGSSCDCNESGVAIISGTQPKRLPYIFDEKMHDNGMVYRFLPMFLNATPQAFSEDDVSSEAETVWSKLISWMYSIDAPKDVSTGCIVKNNLIVDGDARVSWVGFFNNITELRPFMPTQFKGYIPKLITYCLKFMTVLHLLKCFENDELTTSVQVPTVKGAIDLTYFFAGQALKLVLDNSNVQDDPYNAVIRNAIAILETEVNKKGKILLSRVREKVNELLPSGMKLDDNDNRLGTWIREMGFEVKPGAGNKAVVVLGC